MVEKEVLAQLRFLDICYVMLVSREIKVLARYSILAWFVQSSGLNARLGRWAALLSNWTMEVKDVGKEKRRYSVPLRPDCPLDPRWTRC